MAAGTATSTPSQGSGLQWIGCQGPVGKQHPGCLHGPSTGILGTDE